MLVFKTLTQHNATILSYIVFFNQIELVKTEEAR